MRTLRFPRLLSLVAVVLSVGLLVVGHHTPEPQVLDTPYVPTATMLSFGISAPAALLTIPALHPPWLSWSAIGFADSEWYFLVGVAATWWLVGRELERRFKHRKPASPGLVSRAGALTLFALGLIVGYQGIFYIWSQPLNNPTGNKLQSCLFVAWSVSMIVCALPRIARGPGASKIGVVAGVN